LPKCLKAEGLAVADNAAQERAAPNPQNPLAQSIRSLHTFGLQRLFGAFTERAFRLSDERKMAFIHQNLPKPKCG
jgi:hypothetical protein